MAKSMIMAVVAIALMWMCTDVRRQIGDMAVAHAALRDEVIGECLPAPRVETVRAGALVTQRGPYRGTWRPRV